MNISSDSEEHGALVELEDIALRFALHHEKRPLLKQKFLNALLGRHREYAAVREFWLYRGINLRITHGDRLGIVGSNGAGKSTLLKLIAGIYHPTRGRMRLRGRLAPLIELGGGFKMELSGAENIFLNGAILGFSHAEMAAKLQDILRFAGLEDFAQLPVKYYSSGMLVRLGFSIATDIVPEILLLDEIFSAGDAQFREKAEARMHELLKTSHIVVMVSHDLDQITRLCNRAIWLDHGQIVLDGPPAEICQAYLQQRYPAGFDAHPHLISVHS